MELYDYPEKITVECLSYLWTTPNLPYLDPAQAYSCLRAAPLGALVGLGCVALVGQYTQTSFLLYGPIGCLVTMLSAHLLSRLFPPPRPERTRGWVLS